MPEKKFSKKVTSPKTGRTRTVRYGQAGSEIRPGTSKGDAYCARSAKIKGDWRSDPNSPNNLSRRKWKCRGSKSLRESRTPFAYKAVIVTGDHPVSAKAFRGSGLRYIPRTDAFDHHEGRHTEGPRLYPKHVGDRKGIAIDAHGASPRHIAKIRDHLHSSGYDVSLLYTHNPLRATLKQNAFGRRVNDPKSVADTWHRRDRARRMLRDTFGEDAYREINPSRFGKGAARDAAVHAHAARIAREMVDVTLVNAKGRNEVANLAATVRNPKRLIYVGRTPDGKRPLHPAHAVAKPFRVVQESTSGDVSGFSDCTVYPPPSSKGSELVRRLIAKIRGIVAGQEKYRDVSLAANESLGGSVRMGTFAATPDLSAHTPIDMAIPHLHNGRVIRYDGRPYIVREVWQQTPTLIRAVASDLYGHRNFLTFGGHR